MSRPHASERSPATRSAAAGDGDYRRDGFVVHRAVLSPEVIHDCCQEADRLFADEELTRSGNGRTRVRRSLSGATVVDRLDPVCDVSPLFDDLARDRALLDLATAMLGEEPRLFKDKIIVKPQGTAGYTLHQDYMRWQHFPPAPDEMVTLAVSLDPATRLSGAVEVYVGQHDRLLTPPGETADPHPDDVDAARLHTVELDAGDVLALHPLIPHRSDYNRSDRSRRMLFFTYSAGRYGDLRSLYYARHAEIFGAALGPQVVEMPVRRRLATPAGS